MLLTYRFVRLIESHAEKLATSLLEKVQHSSRTTAFSNVPPDELRQRVYEIYDHLGDWLMGKTDVDLEHRYREIGARRFHQQVPLHELIWAIVLTKENLWDFLTWQTMPDRPVEVFGEFELLQLLDRFFGRAICFAAMGYEDARVAAEHVHEGARVGAHAVSHRAAHAG
jgi:hypothetical protein